MPSNIFAFFALARGIGNIVSGPVSNGLLGHNSLSNAKFGYGIGNYVSNDLYVPVKEFINVSISPGIAPGLDRHNDGVRQWCRCRIQERRTLTCC
jgi:hypothetical protein